MELEFLLIDVFTDRPFGGSRLYLFPDGDRCSAEADAEAGHGTGRGRDGLHRAVPRPRRRTGRGLRVFTPAAEIPFGGHSVLGATFALDALGRA